MRAVDELNSNSNLQIRFYTNFLSNMNLISQRATVAANQFQLLHGF